MAFGGLFGNTLYNQLPLGLMGGYMPQITNYQSAIGRQDPVYSSRKQAKKPSLSLLENMPLQYNPIVDLPDIPKPDPFGFFTPRLPGTQPQALGGVLQPGVPQTIAEQAALNAAMGRRPFAGIPESQLTRSDILDFRRTQRAPRQNQPVRGYGQ